ncbi:MAG: class I SAM-dependent methyltransferase [Proteobacteria bacterium]|nr:class I SAM-dependent methyltransferase [Pseudomonadota bacterium]
MQKYDFPSGKLDQERLDIQHICYSKGNFTVLKECLISLNQTVVDAGCGSGAMTEWLAYQVGPYGKVIALDNDPEQLEVASSRAKKAGLTNIQFLNVNLEEDLDDAFKADITFCSMVLTHLKNKQTGVKNLAKFTKKDGYVVAADPINAMCWVSPDNRAYNKIFDLFIDYAMHKSFNANFGMQSGSIFLESDSFSAMTVEGYQPITNIPTLKSYIRRGWEHFRDNVVERHVLTQEEQQQLSQELDNMINSEAFTFGLPINTIVKARV